MSNKTKNIIEESPVGIDEFNWYYHEWKKKSIIFVHEVRDRAGVYIKTDQINIPLKKLTHAFRSQGYIIYKKKGKIK